MPKLFLINISILFLILGFSISGNAQSERKIAKKLMYDGDAKMRGLDFEGALNNYSSAISTDPTYADAYMKRASLLQKLGRPTQAINDYDKAIKLNPYVEYLYDEREKLKILLDDYKGAFTDFNTAIQLAPYEVLWLMKGE